MKVTKLRSWLSDLGEKNKQHYEKGLTRHTPTTPQPLGADPRIEVDDACPKTPSCSAPPSKMKSSPTSIMDDLKETPMDDLKETPSADPTTCTTDDSAPFGDSTQQDASWDTTSYSSWDKEEKFHDAMFEIETFDETNGFKKHPSWVPVQDSEDSIKPVFANQCFNTEPEHFPKPTLLKHQVAASSTFHKLYANTEGLDDASDEGKLAKGLSELSVKSAASSQSVGTASSSTMQSISPAVRSSQVGRTLLGEPMGPSPESEDSRITGDYKQQHDQSTMVAPVVSPARRKMTNPEDLAFLSPKRVQDQKCEVTRPRQKMTNPEDLAFLSPKRDEDQKCEVTKPQQNPAMAAAIRKFGGGRKKTAGIEARKEELEKKWADSRTVKHTRKSKWDSSSGFGNYKKKLVLKAVPNHTPIGAKATSLPQGPIIYSLASSSGNSPS